MTATNVNSELTPQTWRVECAGKSYEWTSTDGWGFEAKVIVLDEIFNGDFDALWIATEGTSGKELVADVYLNNELVDRRGIYFTLSEYQR